MTPDGYIGDDGAVYDPGTGFGWNAPIQSRERGSNVAQTHDTFVFSAATATWELDLPPGTYDVIVSVGDARYGQGPHQVVVEGITVLSGTSTNAAEFVEATTTVTVDDGRLTVDIGGGGGVTAINQIIIATADPPD